MGLGTNLSKQISQPGPQIQPFLVLRISRIFSFSDLKIWRRNIQADISALHSDSTLISVVHLQNYQFYGSKNLEEEQSSRHLSLALRFNPF